MNTVMLGIGKIVKSLVKSKVDDTAAKVVAKEAARVAEKSGARRIRPRFKPSQILLNPSQKIAQEATEVASPNTVRLAGAQAERQVAGVGMPKTFLGGPVPSGSSPNLKLPVKRAGQGVETSLSDVGELKKFLVDEFPQIEFIGDVTEEMFPLVWHQAEGYDLMTRHFDDVVNGSYPGVSRPLGMRVYMQGSERQFAEHVLEDGFLMTYDIDPLRHIMRNGPDAPSQIAGLTALDDFMSEVRRNYFPIGFFDPDHRRINLMPVLGDEKFLEGTSHGFYTSIHEFGHAAEFSAGSRANPNATFLERSLVKNTYEDVALTQGNEALDAVLPLEFAGSEEEAAAIRRVGQALYTTPLRDVLQGSLTDYGTYDTLEGFAETFSTSITGNNFDEDIDYFRKALIKKNGGEGTPSDQVARNFLSTIDQGAGDFADTVTTYVNNPDQFAPDADHYLNAEMRRIAARAGRNPEAVPTVAALRGEARTVEAELGTAMRAINDSSIDVGHLAPRRQRGVQAARNARLRKHARDAALSGMTRGTF